MKVVVLISCMHLNTEEEVMALVHRTNVKGRCVVVSQCDRNEVVLKGLITIVFTTERGLSRSRNLAIRHAENDSVCLVCDDDEILADNFDEIIIDSYTKYKDASVIAFALKRDDISAKNYYPEVDSKMGLRQMLRTSSVQITFKKDDLEKYDILFDVKMGSGTGNGGGEENKFLLDFRRHGLNLYYCASVIGTLLPGDSKWFKGYTSEYLYNLGWSSRRSMGAIMGFGYIFYWAISHKRLYKQNHLFFSAYRNLIRGYFSRR